VILLRADNTLVDRQLSDVHFVDMFNRPNGPIRNGWTDAYDLDGPDYWEQTLIEDGQVQVEARFQDHGGQHLMLGTQMCAIQIPGLTDNFEVGVRWDWGYNTDAKIPYLFPAGDSRHDVPLRDVPFDIVNQISPMSHVDLSTPVRTEIGISAIWDISFALTYFVNAFSIKQDDWYREPPPPPEWSVWQVAMPGTFGAFEEMPFSPPPNPRSEWIVQRCVNNKMMYYWNGKPLCGRGAVPPFAKLMPWDVPAWALGRDWFGFKSIAIDAVIGGLYDDVSGGAAGFNNGVCTRHFKARIGGFYVRSYNGPLL
jgi:hypothetical protein